MIGAFLACRPAVRPHVGAARPVGVVVVAAVGGLGLLHAAAGEVEFYAPAVGHFYVFFSSFISPLLPFSFLFFFLVFSLSCSLVGSEIPCGRFLCACIGTQVG